MILNDVRQHNCLIIQGSYIGYMFRLIDQSSSGLFKPNILHRLLPAFSVQSEDYLSHLVISELG